MKDNLYDVLSNFQVKGSPAKVELYGCGHINDTYLAITESGTESYKYILQRINNNVFPDVEGLMNNIKLVTSYVASSAKTPNSPDLLQIIPTNGGENFVCTENGNYYRLYNFIYNGISIESTPTAEQLYISGTGFGKFQNLLDGFPAELLTEPIRNFHNTVNRYVNFESAVKNDICGRKKYVEKEIAFFATRAHYCSVVTTMLANGKLPTRVTHNDTKLNNVLINVAEKRAVAVIDLDTVMPGSILYDFGDSIRSGANIGAEDEKDLSKVGFSLDLFSAFTRGFVSEVKDKLTDKEVEYLAFGAILMTYECGMRFLTDYLNGDTYFKIHREGHNLDRARTQIKMVEDMEKHLDEMNAVVLSAARPQLILSEKPQTFKLSDNVTGNVSYNVTNVTAAAKNGEIVFDFDVTDDSLIAFGSKYNDPLYKGDVVEAFITLGSPSRYLEIEVNPDGAEYAVIVDNKDGLGDIKVTPLAVCPFTSSAKTNDNGWTASIKIKLSALKELGWVPENAKINLFRQDFRPVGDLFLYALNPTKTNKFHIVGAFIPLTVKEK